MSETTELPRFADWLREYCSQSERPLVRDSLLMVSYCFELDRQLPERYGWRFSDEDVIRARVTAAKNPAEINREYWCDQARNIESYALVTVWRGVELLAPAVDCLNTQKIVPSAVMARSLLELATAAIINANTVESMLAGLDLTGNEVVTSSQLEEYVVKMIWGRRLDDPPPHLKQVNVQTLIQKLAKNPHAQELLPTYEYLCELAHPNFTGNARFWSHIESTDEDGSELRVLSRLGYHQSSSQTLDKIAWSLGWAAVCIRNAFEIISAALNELLSKLGVQSTQMRSIVVH